eukprot:Lithocolla_globosa_v1_NODE_6037_length_1145_cov_142.715596.p1 type:complete len:316 gc:universal NODE_6037_length_1145_cov_142.715596:63-1010(+)
MGDAEDEIVVWGDNEERIKHIQSCIRLPGGKDIELLKPGRILVGEGVLLKQCRKKMKPRQFFLFNDSILYANIIVTRKRYNKHRMINLDSITLADGDDDRGFQILATGKSFAVYTATPDEKKEWMTHINMCIQNLPKAPNSASKSAAALWVPDKATETCMVCSVAKFTTFNRRHHCRSCGKIACGACTANKIVLPSVDEKKPQRVCDICFAQRKQDSDVAITPKPDEDARPASPVGEDSADELKPKEEIKEEAKEDDSDDDDDENESDQVAPLRPGANLSPSSAAKAEGDEEGDDSELFQENVRASVFFTEGQES